MADAAQKLTVSSTDVAVEMAGMNKWYGEFHVLRDINLEIRRGEHWAFVGANGSGKSTLLKLIVGDLHPALGGRVQRFSFTLEHTLWEVKKKIGCLSPELQANYRESLTGSDVIASGFFSSIGLMLEVSPAQRRRVKHLIETWFALTLCTGVFHGDMHAGNLLLTDTGEVVLLDWGIVGRLPEASRRFFRRSLEGALGDESAWPDVRDHLLSMFGAENLEQMGVTPDQFLELVESLRDEHRTLLLASHRSEEVSRLTDRVLLMENGRIVETGARVALTDGRTT